MRSARGIAYDAYLLSAAWAVLRELALERDGYRCRLCDASDDLSVHHRRYPEVLGDETVDDLTTLCDDCHAGFHARKSILDPIDLQSPEVMRLAPIARTERDHVQDPEPDPEGHRRFADAQRPVGRSTLRLRQGDQARLGPAEKVGSRPRGVEPA